MLSNIHSTPEAVHRVQGCPSQRIFCLRHVRQALKVFSAPGTLEDFGRAGCEGGRGWVGEVAWLVRIVSLRPSMNSSAMPTEWRWVWLDKKGDSSGRRGKAETENLKVAEHKVYQWCDTCLNVRNT